MPETLLTSYGLIRGLPEVWSHLAFIADDSNWSDARYRTLRYERGTLCERENTASKDLSYFDREAWRAYHDKRTSDIKGL